MDTNRSHVCPLIPHGIHLMTRDVCREVSPTSKMSVEAQMKSSHVPWAKKEQTTKDIDLDSLFNIYWTSKAQTLTVQGQFLFAKQSAHS